jgi:hypothetical protein
MSAQLQRQADPSRVVSLFYSNKFCVHSAQVVWHRERQSGDESLLFTVGVSANRATKTITVGRCWRDSQRRPAFIKW